jgi:hypothetical protein
VLEGLPEDLLKLEGLFSGLVGVPEYEGLLCVAAELGLEYTGRSCGATVVFSVDFRKVWFPLCSVALRVAAAVPELYGAERSVLLVVP